MSCEDSDVTDALFAGRYSRGITMKYADGHEAVTQPQSHRISSAAFARKLRKFAMRTVRAIDA